MPKRPDDFDADVKEALALRAAYHCSFPGCPTITVGPSEESALATSSTGMACHIAAAGSKGSARRYDALMTSEQRKSIDNGIWLCYKHGKLIDTDEDRYTAPQLKKWRQLAEQRAHIYQTFGKTAPIEPASLLSLGLPRHELSLSSLDDENLAIGQAFDDTCVANIWGKNLAAATRDYAIEMARNAFQHGGSTCFELEIHPDHIVMRDDGEDFDPWSLLSRPPLSGGVISMDHLASHLADKLAIAFRRIGHRNEITVALISELDDLYEVTPCTMKVSLRQIKEREIPIQVNASCRIIYVVLPKFLPISDVLRIPSELGMPKPNDARPIVFVLQSPSPKVLEIIGQNFPNAKLLVLDR